MSKKTRKKIVRKNPDGTTVVSAKVTDSKSAVKTTLKTPVAASKVSISSEDMAKRYQYVKDDLKTIAFIAIPMIVGLFILSYFLKI